MLCSIDWCRKIVCARGMCRRHYYIFYKNILKIKWKYEVTTEKYSIYSRTKHRTSLSKSAVKSNFYETKGHEMPDFLMPLYLKLLTIKRYINEHRSN